MMKETSQDAMAGVPKRVMSNKLRLPKASSLRRKRDYARVYAEGKRARGRLILVVAAPGLYPFSARMGLSVGRKFSASAVVRNRARRVLRAAFRLQRQQMPHLDMILIPVARGQFYRTVAVERELKVLLEKLARRWKESSLRPES